MALRRAFPVMHIGPLQQRERYLVIISQSFRRAKGKVQASLAHPSWVCALRAALSERAAYLLIVQRCQELDAVAQCLDRLPQRVQPVVVGLPQAATAVGSCSGASGGSASAPKPLSPGASR